MFSSWTTRGNPSFEGRNGSLARPMTHVSHGATSPMKTFLAQTSLLGRLVVFVAVAATALLGAQAAMACGNSSGYSYSGMAATDHAFGISATVTPLGSFQVLAGHVAGWVGVGGPGEGPNGSDEWLQVGFSGFPQLTGNDLYFEVTQPSGNPTYHQLQTDIPFGQSMRVAVLEMHKRPNFWRVWVNRKPASNPIYLPQSHDRWSPIATAESWDGGTGGTCNDFLYRFHGVSIARFPGGGWHELLTGYQIGGPSTRLTRNAGSSSFIAAEGDDAFRSLASFTP
jgi:hypothetical protein